MKGIIYLLIANDSSAPVGEVCLATGNFQLISLKILSKVRNEKNTSKSFSYQNEYNFHYHNSNGLYLLCMTDFSYSNRLSYQFLFHLRDKLFKDFGSQITQAIAYSLNEAYLSSLKDLMTQFNDPESVDKISVVDRNVKDVIDIMLLNIEKILERGEKIEELVVKSKELEEKAVIFKKKVEKVRCLFCKQHYKVVIVVVVLVAALLVSSILFLCGGVDLENCRNHSSRINSNSTNHLA